MQFGIIIWEVKKKQTTALLKKIDYPIFGKVKCEFMVSQRCNTKESIH